MNSRKLAARAILAACAVCLGGGRAGEAPALWLDQLYLKTHMELNVPNRPLTLGEKFDPTAFQEATRASHVQVVTVFSKDAYGNSFFETQHGYFDKRLKFNLVAREVEALHSLGLKVLTHYSVGDDSHIDLYHPDWLCKDVHGKPLEGGPLSNRACMNSPYREEMLLPQLEELARLGLDGLWLDIFSAPEGCFCRHCQARFRQKYGAALTPNAPRRFEFWSDSLDDTLREVNRRTRAINPNIAITYNGAHLLRHAREHLVDFFTVESHVNASTGYEIHQIQARYLRALGVPFDIQNMTNIERWDDSTLKSPELLKLEFSQIVAQGGRISAGTQLYPTGEYDSVVAGVLGEAYRFIEDRLPFVRGSRPARYAAVLLPEAPRRARGSWRFASDPNLVGLITALDQLHLQFDVIEGSNSGYELLSNYKVAILPEAGEIAASTEGRAAMERFFKAGGKALAVAADVGVQESLPWADVRRLAKPIGKLYYETGYPEWRTELARALSDLKIEPLYAVQAPANVDVNLMERPGESLLHLVNIAVQKGLPGLMPQVWKVPPSPLIRVSVRCPRPASVQLEPGDRPVQFTYDGSSAQFTIPEVQIYEIARIRY